GRGAGARPRRARSLRPRWRALAFAAPWRSGEPRPLWQALPIAALTLARSVGPHRPRVVADQQRAVVARVEHQELLAGADLGAHQPQHRDLLAGLDHPLGITKLRVEPEEVGALHPVAPEELLLDLAGVVEGARARLHV